MSDFVKRTALAAALCAGFAAASFQGARADDAVSRGKYLVTIIGCTDCHTPGSLIGKPDTKRFLAGSEVGFDIPGLGIFAPRNLTPDKDTGIGTWTAQQIATAITTGARPDGRVLAPVMPWGDFAHLSKGDALAIAAYLKTLSPVKNKVPDPFGPGQKPTVLVDTIVPPAVYGKLPKPK
jgi:mono/diheme cytochrome c family protein